MKYYLIPVVEDAIFYNGESLKDIFDRVFPVLSKREDERIDILYSTRIFEPIPEKELKAHNKETKRMYSIEKVPTYLIAAGTSDLVAHEVVTGKKLCAKYSSALGVRKISKENAEGYFNNNDYLNKVSNYFSHVCEEEISSSKLDNEPFAETYEGSFYLDGELDGRPFKGTFSGSLKLKKRNHI